MSWLTLGRVPEPEVMSAAEEAAAYASAAAEAYLDQLDNTLVEQVMGLGIASGRVLDVGTGPGGIPLKLARRCPDLRIIGVDRSRAMIRQAQAAQEQGGSGGAHGGRGRVEFFVADANRLCFSDASFALVLSNSLLHHLAEPARVLAEMARVARTDGVILLRDLRRPSRPAFPWHVRWYGRPYSGLMKKLYIASVRAAYTAGELRALLDRVPPLREAKLFFFGRTHVGFVRDGRTGL